MPSKPVNNVQQVVTLLALKSLLEVFSVIGRKTLYRMLHSSECLIKLFSRLQTESIFAEICFLDFNEFHESRIL